MHQYLRDKRIQKTSARTEMHSRHLAYTKFTLISYTKCIPGASPNIWHRLPIAKGKRKRYGGGESSNPKREGEGEK